MRLWNAVRALGVIGMLIPVAISLGCGGGSISGDGDKLKQIVITPASAQIPKGETVQLNVMGVFADGKQRALETSPTWQTTESTVATVNAQGNVTGVGTGTAQVSATYRAMTGSTTITVGTSVLMSIAVTPNQATLPVGESQQLTAAGTFSDGTVQDLTQSSAWSSSAAVVTVSVAGMAVANATGTTTISATSGSVSGSASLTITPPATLSLSITPSSVSVSLGNNTQLRALATLSDGTSQDVTTTSTWQTNQPAIATVNTPGFVTGVGRGAALVSAAYQGITASAAVAVGPPSLVSIAVSPNQSSLPVGKSLQFSATGKFSDGSVKDLSQSTAWSSSAIAIANVSAGGNTAAIAVGTATITAVTGSIAGSASLTVSPPSVTALNVTPTTLSLSLGNSSPLQAIATLSDGTTQDVTGVSTWTTNQSTIAAVNAQGSVTGMGRGDAVVSAAYQGMTANAAVAVGPPSLVSIAVSPNQFSLPIGESEQFTATGKFSDGSVQNLGPTSVWSSSGSSIATVNTSGKASAITVGTVTVSATSGSVTGTASLTVSPVAVTSLNIFPGTFSLVVGSGFQFKAIATMSDGTTQDKTATALWSSMQPSIAAVNGTGMLTAMQVGSTTILAQNSGVSASADVTVMPLALVNYFNQASSAQSGIDGTVQLSNPGLAPGDLCAMVYVFDQNQELNECCGCTISDSGLRTLSVLADLTANPLTGVKPRMGEIKVIPSDPAQNPQCDAGTLAPAGAVVGWATHTQILGGGAQVTESKFESVPLTTGEASVLANECTFLKQLGSGHGTCSCGTGD